MTKITKKITKANEEKVLYLLDKVLGGKWKLAQDNYSVYDISGTDRDNNKALVEVKLRTKLFPKLWIEEDKVFSIADKFTETGATKALLVCSIDDKHYLYDFKRIADFPVVEREMNGKTSSDFTGYGIKKVKRVYEFPWSEYMYELSEGEMGSSYEQIKDR